jgi:DNA primase
MSGTIPQSFIQDLICRTDIVEVVKNRVQFTKEHTNNCIGLCPFHREKTPSFSVSRDKQFYYCFGCGAHGNVIKFLMEFEHLDFVTTIEMLAQQAGMPIPYESGKAALSGSFNQYYDCMALAVHFYEKNLKSDQNAITYLKSRHLTGKAAKYFHLGTAPNQWHALSKHLNIKKDILLKVGLLVDGKKNTYDRFRHRLIFPIRDIRGRFVGIGARTLTDEQPKYINSPETVIFHKNQELYGLYESLQQHASKLTRVLIVEGYMDVISLFQHGINYAVATLGTAINTQHLYKLLRYTTEVVFCFDGDAAGKNAAKKALKIALTAITDDRKISFMFLPQKEDPDTLIQRIGKRSFEKLIDNATPLSDFFFNQIQTDIPLTSLDNKVRFAKEVTDRLRLLPNSLFKRFIEDKLRHLLAISSHTLEDWLQKTADSKKPHIKQKTSLPQKMHPGLSVIAILLNNPSLITLIDNPKALENLDFKYGNLMTSVLLAFKEKPKASIGYLFTVLDSSYHALIAKLSTFTLPSAKADIQAEFQGALMRLEALQQKANRQRLINIAKERTLTAEEKEELKRLLSTDIN